MSCCRLFDWLELLPSAADENNDAVGAFESADLSGLAGNKRADIFAGNFSAGILRAASENKPDQTSPIGAT